MTKLQQCREKLNHHYHLNLRFIFFRGLRVNRKMFYNTTEER